MRIAVVGLGYVGCPLAYELSRHFDGIIGYDINRARVLQLRVDGVDRTGELTDEQVRTSSWLLSSDEECLMHKDVYIVTVPTPITDANVPDLTPVVKATEMLAQYIQPGAIVVYESTVYPAMSRS